MPLLVLPSAASRMILARITRTYGNVYLRTICCRYRFSRFVRTIEYGLFLGIWYHLQYTKDTIRQHKTQSKYVTVFMNACT
jgi:hypothetical protein